MTRLVTDDKRFRQSFFFAIFADLGIFARTPSLLLAKMPKSARPPYAIRFKCSTIVFVQCLILLYHNHA